MKITYLGHSCIYINGPKNILIDPFIRLNPNLNFKIDSIKPDYILVSHAHFDHVGDTILIAQKTSATIIAGVELAQYLEGFGVKTIGLNIGGKINFDNVSIKMVNAIHSSSLENGKSCGVANGFLLFIDNICIYHSGDTDIFSDMKNYFSLYNIDYAFLPIGGHYTMGIDEAVIASKWLKCKNVIPIHYNTFDSIIQNPKIFKEKIEAEKSSNCIILNPLDKIDII